MQVCHCDLFGAADPTCAVCAFPGSTIADFDPLYCLPDGSQAGGRRLMSGPDRRYYQWSEARYDLVGTTYPFVPASTAGLVALGTGVGITQQSMTITNTTRRPLQIMASSNSYVTIAVQSSDRVNWQADILINSVLFVSGGGSSALGGGTVQDVPVDFTVPFGVLPVGGTWVVETRLRYQMTSGAPSALTGILEAHSSIDAWGGSI